MAGPPKGSNWGVVAGMDLPRWVRPSCVRWRPVAAGGSRRCQLPYIAGVRAISVVGMRLGAAVALQACAAGSRVLDLVLWDPVVRGADHLAEWEALDTRRNLTLLHRLPARREELLGFPMTAKMRASIE